MDPNDFSAPKNKDDMLRVLAMYHEAFGRMGLAHSGYQRRIEQIAKALSEDTVSFEDVYYRANIFGDLTDPMFRFDIEIPAKSTPEPEPLVAPIDEDKNIVVEDDPSAPVF